MNLTPNLLIILKMEKSDIFLIIHTYKSKKFFVKDAKII